MHMTSERICSILFREPVFRVLGGQHDHIRTLIHDMVAMRPVSNRCKAAQQNWGPFLKGFSFLNITFAEILRLITELTV